ncbi:MAG: protein kinase, partial [Myxococcota bacterium]
MREKLPKWFGPYLLTEKIGQGGMAEIFRANVQQRVSHLTLQEVAIKRILNHLASNEEFIRQLLEEARIAGSLNHPNIVQVVDVSKIDGEFYIAMEYVHGRHLGQVVRGLA